MSKIFEINLHVVDCYSSLIFLIFKLVHPFGIAITAYSGMIDMTTKN